MDANAAGLAEALRLAIVEQTRELRALRDDLGRIYGRNPDGTLRAVPPEGAAQLGPLGRRGFSVDDLKDLAYQVTGRRAPGGRRPRR